MRWAISHTHFPGYYLVQARERWKQQPRRYIYLVRKKSLTFRPFRVFDTSLTACALSSVKCSSTGRNLTFSNGAFQFFSLLSESLIVAASQWRWDLLKNSSKTNSFTTTAGRLGSAYCIFEQIYTFKANFQPWFLAFSLSCRPTSCRWMNPRFRSGCFQAQLTSGT